MGKIIKGTAGPGDDVGSPDWAEEVAARLRTAPIGSLGAKSVSRRDALGLIGLGASAIGGASMPPIRASASCRIARFAAICAG